MLSGIASLYGKMIKHNQGRLSVSPSFYANVPCAKYNAYNRQNPYIY